MTATAANYTKTLIETASHNQTSLVQDTIEFAVEMNFVNLTGNLNDDISAIFSVYAQLEAAYLRMYASAIEAEPEALYA